MGLTKEEMETKIEQIKGDIEQHLQRLEGKPSDESLASNYRALYLDYDNAATYALLIEDAERARYLFSQAAENALKFVRDAREYRKEIERDWWEVEPEELEHALTRALLAGNDELLADAVGETEDLDELYLDEFPDNPTWYHRPRALAAVIDDEDPRPYLEQLGAVADGTFAQALLTIYEGLVDRNEQHVRSGIEQIVQYHERIVGSDPSERLEFINHIATALLVLARTRGLDISVDSEFIPSDYIEFIVSNYEK